jgi:hypothetical protein
MIYKCVKLKYRVSFENCNNNQKSTKEELAR